MSTSPERTWFAVILAMVALSAAVAAQDKPERPVEAAPSGDEAEAPPTRPPALVVGIGGTWRPEAKFDDSEGKVAHSDSDVWARFSVPLSEKAFLFPMLYYRHTYFSWGRNHDFLDSRKPWTDLHRLALDANLHYRFNEEIGLFAGAGIGVAGEADALSNAWFGTARAGLRVNPTENLTVGMGFHWSTGLEDRTYFLLPLFSWKFHESWVLATQRGGLRLGFDYPAADALSLGAFCSYEAQRWKLGSGATPRKGYARLSGARAGLDARWDITDTVSLEAELGADFLRRLTAYNRDDRREARDKLAAAPFFGLRLSVGF